MEWKMLMDNYPVKIKKYKGSFIQDKIICKGERNYVNGYLYNCNFLNGKRNGFGKMVYSHGVIYKGELIDDQYKDKGVYIYKNKDILDC